VTYWVSHSSIQGVFLEWTLSKSCEEDGMDGRKTWEHGFHEIQGCVLSHLWVPL
jgi:hypothetical protein